MQWEIQFYIITYIIICTYPWAEGAFYALGSVDFSPNGYLTFPLNIFKKTTQKTTHTNLRAGVYVCSPHGGGGGGGSVDLPDP